MFSTDFLCFTIDGFFWVIFTFFVFICFFLYFCSFKSSFSRELKSKMVYKYSCSGCNSTYVGKTVQYLITRVVEHRKEDSLGGQNLRQCGNEGTSAVMSWEVIDEANTNVKLLIF